MSGNLLRLRFLKVLTSINSFINYLFMSHMLFILFLLLSFGINDFSCRKRFAWLDCGTCRISTHCTWYRCSYWTAFYILHAVNQLTVQGKMWTVHRLTRHQKSTSNQNVNCLQCKCLPSYFKIQSKHGITRIKLELYLLFSEELTV